VGIALQFTPFGFDAIQRQPDLSWVDPLREVFSEAIHAGPWISSASAGLLQMVSFFLSWEVEIRRRRAE
jgi:hypothetical protein